MSDENELEIEDQRLEFLADNCLKWMKLRADKWSKMFTYQENKKVIMEFLDNQEPEILIFYLNKSGSLVPSVRFPHHYNKSKAFYVIKHEKEPISKQLKMKDLVSIGDIYPMPIEQLSCFIDEVT